MRIATFLAALLLWAGSAAAQCDESCRADLRREQAEARRAAFDVDAFGVQDLGGDLQIVSYGFERSRNRAMTYSGRDVGILDYPASGGFVWLLRIDPDLQGDVFQVRDVLDKAARREPNRYLVTPDVLLDIDKGIELRINSTIRFFAENRDRFPGGESVRVVLSGPFWRQEEYGEDALGLVKNRRDGLVQGWLDFSARHVLCFPESGVDLIDADLVSDRLDGEILPAELTVAMEREVRSRCEAAIQVGPTFIERRRQRETGLQYGISGASVREAARNIVMAVAREGGGSDVFVVTTMSSISSFDMMVVLERIAALAFGEREILWAVGIQDEELLSGPLMIRDGRAISLNSIDNPAGALVVFSAPE